MRFLFKKSRFYKGISIEFSTYASKSFASVYSISSFSVSKGFNEEGDLCDTKDRRIGWSEGKTTFKNLGKIGKFKKNEKK